MEAGIPEKLFLHPLPAGFPVTSPLRETIPQIGIFYSLSPDFPDFLLPSATKIFQPFYATLPLDTAGLRALK